MTIHHYSHIYSSLFFNFLKVVSRLYGYEVVVVPPLLQRLQHQAGLLRHERLVRRLREAANMDQ